LLNIVWLLLVVPAAMIWRRSPGPALKPWSKLNSLLVLGCMLLLLFPVVSASDDLHAMRPEIEESSLSKKAAQYASANDSHSGCSCHGPQLAACGEFAFSPDSVIWVLAPHRPSSPSQEGAVYAPGLRAPPIPLLA